MVNRGRETVYLAIFDIIVVDCNCELPSAKLRSFDVANLR